MFNGLRAHDHRLTILIHNRTETILGNVRKGEQNLRRGTATIEGNDCQFLQLSVSSNHTWSFNSMTRPMLSNRLQLPLRAVASPCSSTYGIQDLVNQTWEGRGAGAGAGVGIRAGAGILAGTDARKRSGAEAGADEGERASERAGAGGGAWAATV